MKRGLGLLMLACASFGAALGHAAVLDLPAVNHAAVAGAAFPPALSDFRFFIDGARQSPNTDVRPYALNTPLWSDGADKLRFIYLPEGTQLTADGAKDGGGLLHHDSQCLPLLIGRELPEHGRNVLHACREFFQRGRASGHFFLVVGSFFRRQSPGADGFIGQQIHRLHSRWSRLLSVRRLMPGE